MLWKDGKRQRNSHTCKKSEVRKHGLIISNALLSNWLHLQSAMEYLVTYGWAILIISVVLMTLFQLGVFNSTNFAPRASSGSCRVFRPGGPNTVLNINLEGMCSGQLPKYVAQFSGAGFVNAGNILNLGQVFTVSAWVETTTNDDTYHTVAMKGSDANREFFIMEYRSGNTGELVAGVYDTNGVQYPIYAFIPVIGKWYHVLLMYDGNIATFYINDVYEGQKIVGVRKTTILPFSIGAMSDPDNYWNGAIANVQIYSTSLPATDIKTLYIEGIGGAPPFLQNIIGWWPLNGDTNDYSGNSNNGAPTGISYTSSWANSYTTT
ncbi:MAG: LamG domain-containing protein [Candidatus Micrarchaeales archaeon]|jgi:hypothetical protein